MRVGQFWAGKERGALFTPRIGDEVMVAYEEGDPDRPIVVGSVYNGSNEISLDLPGRKTVSGLLGKSSKGGGSSIHTANGWWIDDLKGSTLAAASSLDKSLKGNIKTGADKAAAVAVGKLIAQRAQEKGVKDVIFDRGGYLYHGRVKALAEAAREAGLKF